MKCPCKGCTDRWVSDTSRCHSTCEKFKGYRTYIEKSSEKIRQIKARQDSANMVLYRSKVKR